MASPIENLPVFPVQENEDINKLPVFPIAGAEQEKDSFLGSTVSTFGDIAQGVGSGLIGLPQGIVETVTSGFDYIFDTDSTEDVTAFAEGTKEFLGLTPRYSW